ncbi:hypothetical protein HYV43_02365 [Candidatus Micrarchaeota archaeon]|nr:hypothetical protein [Candidatus Micrarchaeota archaeon]
MKLIAIFSVVVMAAAFAGVYGYNTIQPEPVQLTPPYAFSPNDVVSELLALAFVFSFSLLFFGYGAPLALGIEGVKFASLYTTGAVPQSYLLLMLPQVFLALSATYLGQGLLNDYQGKGIWHEYAKKSVIHFIVALILWAAVFFGRPYLPI